MDEIRKNNKILAIILIIGVIWIYMNWGGKQENFTICGEPKKWGNQWYYSNPYHQVTPSIVNYDSSNYKLPKSSLELIKREQLEKKRMQETEAENIDTGLPPMPQNVHSGQTSQVGGNENINEVGAPLDNIFKYEINDMNSNIPTDISSQMENTNQLIIYGAGSEMSDNQSQESSLIKELPRQEGPRQEGPRQEINISEEQQYKSEEEEMMRMKEEEMMVQEESNEIQPMIVKINKVDYNMSITILLIVILIGFAYLTRDY